MRLKTTLLLSTNAESESFNYLFAFVDASSTACAQFAYFALQALVFTSTSLRYLLLTACKDISRTVEQKFQVFGKYAKIVI